MSKFTIKEFQTHLNDIEKEIKALKSKKSVWIEYAETRGYDLINGKFVEKID